MEYSETAEEGSENSNFVLYILDDNVAKASNKNIVKLGTVKFSSPEGRGNSYIALL